MSKKIFSALITLVAVFSFFIITHKAEAAIFRTQTISGSTTMSSNATLSTVSASWPSSTISGHLLVAVLGVNGGTAVTIIPPSGGWTQAARVNNGTNVTSAIYYIQNASVQSGASSWSLSFATARHDSVLTLIEYSGVDISSALDKIESSATTGNSSTASSGTTATTSQINEVAVAGLSFKAGGSATLGAPTSGFTQVNQTSTGGSATSIKNAAEEKILSSTGIQNTSSSLSSGSTQWSGAIATFKEAATAPGIPDMTAATDTGSSDTDNITLNTTPAFTISCVTGLTVTLFDNVTSVGTGTCAASTVTIASSSFSQGVHSINAKQDGSAASGNLSITIDTTAPNTTILTNPTNPSHSSSASFTFSSEVGATFQCDLDSTGYSSCTSPKSYTSLSDGSHTFSVKATDTAGNTDLTPATFSWDVITSYTLTIPAKTGTGIGSYGGTSAGSISYNTAVSITTTPDASSTFTSWTATGAASACNGTTTSPCAFNMTGNASVTAVYTLKTFTLTYTAGAHGSITGILSQTVNYNGSGTQVTATPDAGYHFVSWSDSVMTAARTDSSVVANISVTASFVINAPVLDHFVIDTISTQTAGTAFDIVITAKDNSGNTVTGFVGTVDLTTNSGSITPTISGSFVGGIRTESVNLTGYGAGRTITATRTGSTETATSNIFNVNSSATKFVIINPTNNSVDNNVNVTIQAQDGSNTLVSDYSGDVTLVLSGDATFVSGTGLVHLVNGTVTKLITDHTAQTVDLSLLDTTPTHLNVDSTQNVIFSPGNLHHFGFDTISSPQTASSNISVTITAKDLYGNTVTSFGGTVNFSTTASSITPTISNNFSSGTLTQNVRVTQSGAGKTITATKTGSSENGISNSFTVNSGVTAKLILTNNVSMTAGTRIGYTVTREDQNNNLVTSGSDTVYLSTTSGPTSKFYDAATDGAVITQISIPDGESLVHFWYYDDNEGTWSITASNHTSATDGTDSIIVSIAPVVPTQFIFEVVPSATVGDTVSVSVKAVDASNNLATSYNRTDSSLVLNSTGHSTASGAGISFNINDGVGSINISDTTAENITLSLSDNHPDVPPLSLNTQDVTFNPGIFDHFSMDTISSPQTVGSDIGIVITAKDSHNNTATSFGGTVNFSTTAGSITPTISNNFSSGTLTQNVRVTQSGAGKTITATKTGDVQNITSNTFDVNPGNIANFIVEASGGGSIGTQTIAVPFDIKITAKDSFGNIATGFTGIADISSTGTLASGNITASFVSGILSAHHVTISNTGSFTITATRTGGSETGTSNIFTVSSAPIVATKFIILDPSDVQVGGSTTVTVKAVDNSGDVDSTFQGDINLVVSGSATGAGLVDIVNGVGTKTITDSVVETVGLSLSDIVPPTTLDFSSTQNVSFTTIPSAASLGGGGSIYVAPTSIISFSGQAFPSGNLTAFAISNGAVPIKQYLIKTADGKFDLNFSSGLSGTNQYGIFVTDKTGNISQVKIFTMENGVPNLDVKGLIMSPTADLLRTNLSKGDFLSISGFATPNSTVLFEIDGVVITGKVTAAIDGSYKLLWNTAALSLGKHTLRVKQTTTEGLSSGFSPTRDFNLTNYIITPTDFNSDGKINISDMSIFLSLWYNKNNPDRIKIDLNHDGKVDIQDLSIFSRTLYK